MIDAIQLWSCWDASSSPEGVPCGSAEVEAESLLQQIQLYNVALKQEDREHTRCRAGSSAAAILLHLVVDHITFDY